MIAPEQVERALRSWRDTDDTSLRLLLSDGNLTESGALEVIGLLARHVAAVLSSEPLRIEVQGPLEQLEAVGRMLAAEGEAHRQRLRECGIPGFNGA